MASVNRYLKDKAMDHIDHALGRPVDPTVESYRNRFATDDPDMFADDPHWRLIGETNGMLFFAVTDAGRLALKAHLKAIGDKHREFTVHIKGYGDMLPRAAKSHGAARYAAWLDFSDTRDDVSFGEFQKISSVRL